MLIKPLSTRSPLSQFVEVLWMREGDNLPQTQSYLLPIGSMELVINLLDDRIPLFVGRASPLENRESRSQIGNTSGSMLCGAHSQGFIIDNDSKISMMGVHFKAGGSAPFFTLPAEELHNQRVSLTELWHSRATELRDRLLEASTWAARFLVLEKFLLMLMQPPDRYNAVDFALREFVRSPTLTVSEVTDKIGFSARYFNQIFRNRVGLTPKLFCRIRRLQQVLDLISGKERVDWADVAITCGYFDQAHFIHDFRMFANCTPTEYLAQRVTTGKEACRQGRAIFFNEMLVEFRESRLLGQDIAVSADRTYDFVVVSNWYNDFTIKYGDRIIDNKSSQLSIGYWKDGLVVKESYNYPVISMT